MDKEDAVHIYNEGFVVVKSLSRVQPFVTPWTGLPVLHHLPELAHVQWVAIQPSHPLSSPSHPAFNLSQHQGLF